METITLRALVVYESMFGGTEKIARAIANGLEQAISVRVGSVEQIQPSDVAGVDLLVVGGPTHAHAMSHPATRAEAIEWTHDPAKNLQLAPGMHTIGVREWLQKVADVPRFAAFDTRASIPRIFSGAASHGIARELAKRGGTSMGEPESFLVDSASALADGEVHRAIAWGDTLAAAVVDSVPIS
jgi:hypothetical protein